MIIENISYSAAFLAGLLSFFSPCILPLLPAYFTFITGYSLDELNKASFLDIRKKVFLSTFFYVLGFSTVFVILGASASFLGGLLYKYKSIIRIVGGFFIILFGAHLTGIVRIKFFDYEKRITADKKTFHFFSAFIIGMAFGAGWTPCIGPLLGSILIIAGNRQSLLEGISLLSIYSAGLAIPFLIISIFIEKILEFLKKILKRARILHMASGILLIILGGLLLFNKI